jgi:predicted DCC family thiol-disulfide oxidoreductase YuxK
MRRGEEKTAPTCPAAQRLRSTNRMQRTPRLRRLSSLRDPDFVYRDSMPGLTGAGSLIRSVRLLATMTLPHDNLILFDGVCNFCISSVQFIIRHDRGAVFRFIPIQSDLGRVICRTAGLDPDDIRTFLVLTKDRALIRSDAALEVAKQLCGLWRLWVVFKIVPRGLRDWVYSFVARHRYRWFGRRDACMIPSDNVRERFLVLNSTSKVLTTF